MLDKVARWSAGLEPMNRKIELTIGRIFSVSVGLVIPILVGIDYFGGTSVSPWALENLAAGVADLANRVAESYAAR